MNPNVAEIQNLPVTELADKLGDLSDDDLAALRKAEAGSEKPRSTALEAIDAEAVRRAAAGDSPEGTPPDATTAKAGPKADEDKNAWREQDYTGPLSADQAAWRHANLKPVDVAATKPVKGVVTK